MQVACQGALRPARRSSVGEKRGSAFDFAWAYPPAVPAQKGSCTSRAAGDTCPCGAQSQLEKRGPAADFGRANPPALPARSRLRTSRAVGEAYLRTTALQKMDLAPGRKPPDEERLASAPAPGMAPGLGSVGRD